jgi:8-oxo-dGTP pyrophosphatase MutT (NUDIX family)
MNYHPIQKQILTKFLAHPEQRYSEIKIPEIENDLFNYHLQYLVKIGILDKNEQGYKLSTEGLKEVLMFDSKGNIYQGLRVSILLYIIDYPNKQILAQKHIRQPYLGDINAGISGKVLPGELIETAATRKLQEETGLTGTAKFVGVNRMIRQNSDKSFLDDGLFHICVCTDYSGELIATNEFGENFWIDFAKALEYEKDTTSKGKGSLVILEKILAQDFSPFYNQEIITYNPGAIS